jgi:hypothetical protein
MNVMISVDVDISSYFYISYVNRIMIPPLYNIFKILKDTKTKITASSTRLNHSRGQVSPHALNQNAENCAQSNHGGES